MFRSTDTDGLNKGAHRYSHDDLAAAIEVIVQFIAANSPSGIDVLRREVGALKEKLESDAVEERFLNQKQAAEFLGYSASYIRRLWREGKFPEPTRMSAKDLRWSQVTLTRWAASRKIGKARGGAIELDD